MKKHYLLTTANIFNPNLQSMDLKKFGMFIITYTLFHFYCYCSRWHPHKKILRAGGGDLRSFLQNPKCSKAGSQDFFHKNDAFLTFL